MLIRRIVALGLCAAIAAPASAQTVASYRNSDRMAGYSITTAQGLSYIPSMTLTDAAGVPTGTATSPQSVISRGAASMATGQVSVGTTAVQVVAARAGRHRVTANVTAANTCSFGNSGVTSTTGFQLQPVAGASVTLDVTGALFAVCSATTTVTFVEQF